MAGSGMSRCGEAGRGKAGTNGSAGLGWAWQESRNSDE